MASLARPPRPSIYRTGAPGAYNLIHDRWIRISAELMPVGHFRLTPTRAHRFWTWAPRVGGRDATSKWFESASWISFAGINDPETAECVSRRCGATTVEVDQLSRSLQSRGSSRTRSKQIAARPLIQPDEVLRMPADEQIAFTAGLRLRCGRAIWFRRDDMRGCVKQKSLMPRPEPT